MTSRNDSHENTETPSLSHEHEIDHGNRRDRQSDNFKDKSFERTVETKPEPDAWKTVAVGTIVPLGMAISAAAVTYGTQYERVAMTAWIAVAVVGSASVIAAASVARRRVVSSDRADQGKKEVIHSNEKLSQNIR